jgi:hypothetical protein
MWKEKATVFLTPSGDEWSGGLAGEVRAAMPRGSVKVCFRPERRKSYRPRPLWKAGSKKLPAQEESCHLHRPEQFCVCVGVCGCVCVCVGRGARVPCFFKRLVCQKQPKSREKRGSSSRLGSKMKRLKCETAIPGC